jgi:hypothetical protein
METFISSDPLIIEITRPFGSFSINQSLDQSGPPTIR